MKKLFSWSKWSIATKILVTFLGLSIISMVIIGYMALYYIRDMGDYSLASSVSLGQSAINDSSAHLVKLGEGTINQISQDVAKQVEMYLANQSPRTLTEMRKDQTLRTIAVQLVGTTGYTTILDPHDYLIVIHKFPEQEKNLSYLKEILPSFWALLLSSTDGRASAGYYDWMEVDGSIHQKYASITPIHSANGTTLTLWATTYIDEFSRPVEDTRQEINTAIAASSNYINDNVAKIRDIFLIIFTILVNIVVGLSLLLSRVITRPILALKRGAEEIGLGKLDYKLTVRSKDELGDLAYTFNRMGTALKSNMEELKRTAVENIAKERRIQENLRIYAQKASEAQEAERKRVARELHDETAQALVVVLRHLDDLAAGNSRVSAKDIREEVRKILEGVRHFSQELRPSILDDLGLIPAVQWLASDLSKNYGIAVETEVTGNRRPLPSESELMLFRIIQEALTNVRKHSQASRALVSLDFTPKNIKVTIYDNGKGFNMPARVGDLTRTGKLGLVGMQERVQLLGGSLNVQSQIGKGTTVMVEAPI